MKTLLLIDGNAIMHRAFHAIPLFETKSGIPTNVIYGFLSMILKSIQDFTPDSIIVCFDTPKETFRNKLHKEYQSQRPKIDDSFIVQIPLVKDMLDTAHILRLEMDGYEADDVIGTIVEKYKKDMKVLILTGDKDIFQLIDSNVYVVSPKFGFASTIIYDEKAVFAKLGIAPKKISDWKSLAGDPSDNYKGADGIGPKTAAKLINEYGSTEAILEQKSFLPKGKIRDAITKHEKEIRMCKELATIVTNVPIDIDISKSTFSTFATSSFRVFLERMEMNSLVQRIFYTKEKTVIKPKPPEKKKDDSVQQSELF